MKFVKNIASALTIGILIFLLIGVSLENDDLKKEIKRKPKIVQSTIQSMGRIIRMKVTAYCPCEKCCKGSSDGKTSKNRDAWTTLGVAAAPDLLDYWTKLWIPGVGERIVDDTGGDMRKSARQGIYHIDVRFHNHDEAKKFGVQYLNVEIL